VSSRAAPLRLLLLLVGACAAGPARAPAAGPTGVLVVRCPVADAVLVVDEQPIGELAELSGGVRLRAGEHRLELRHDRYHTRYALVTVAPGETRALDLTLAEALP
jgi:hypothetical protein